ADDRVGVVAGHQRSLRPDADGLAEGVQVENQVLVRRDAPGSEKAGQRFIVCNFAPAHLQRWIEKDQRAPAVFDILLHGVNLRLEIIAAGSSDNQHGAIGRDLGGLEQADRFRGVLFLAEQFLKARVAAALGIVNLVFSAARSEANRAGGVLQIANEGASDALFGQALSFVLVGADLDDCSSIVLYVGDASDFGFFGRVNVLYVDLRREIGVLLELIAAIAKALRLIEVGDGGVLLETLDDLSCLFGERIALVGGRVECLVVAIGQNVDDRQHR